MFFVKTTFGYHQKEINSSLNFLISSKKINGISDFFSGLNFFSKISNKFSFHLKNKNSLKSNQ